MTQHEAAAIIAKLLKAYPTQRRDADFQGMLALELVTSGLAFPDVARRVSEWIRSETFWPSIAELVAPFETAPGPPPKLIAPAEAIPNEAGLEILRRAVFREFTCDWRI